jgi:hypothetical protein
MGWNCTLTEERLSDFLEGTLLVEEQAAFAAHRAGCAHCREMVAHVDALLGQLHAIEPLPTPPQLAARILTATRGEFGAKERRRGWAWWPRWAPAVWQPRVAMGIATALATLVIVVHALSAAPGGSKIAQLNPLHVVRAGNRQVHLAYAHTAKFVNDLRVVYEIEALMAQPQAAAPPVTPPNAEPQQNQMPEQDSHPAGANPREKTQAMPRRNNLPVISNAELAMIGNMDTTNDQSSATLRSLP